MSFLIKCKIDNEFSNADLNNFLKIIKKDQKKDAIIDLISINEESIDNFLKLIKIISESNNISAKIYIYEFDIIDSLKNLVKSRNVS